MYLLSSLDISECSTVLLLWSPSWCVPPHLRQPPVTTSHSTDPEIGPRSGLQLSDVSIPCSLEEFSKILVKNIWQKYLAFRIPNPGLCCTRLRRPTLRAGPRARGWRTALVSQIRTNVILWTVVGRLEPAEKNQFVAPLYSCNKKTIYLLSNNLTLTSFDF